MGVRDTSTERKVAMFDSVTGFAFGPVFDTEADLEEFMEWWDETSNRDLRDLSDAELEEALAKWDQFQSGAHV